MIVDISTTNRAVARGVAVVVVIIAVVVVVSVVEAVGNTQ